MKTEERVENSVLLSKVVGVLDNARLPYYVLGNFAVEAITSRAPETKHRRFDGLSIDIDILTPAPEQIAKVLREQNLLDEGIAQILHLRDRQVDLGINKCLDITDQKNPILRFRSIGIPLPREVFKVNPVCLNGVNFPTLPAETLFHLYDIAWLPTRSSRSNRDALADFIKLHPTPNLQKELYLGLAQYQNQRKEKYALRAFMIRSFLGLKNRFTSILFERKRLKT